MTTLQWWLLAGTGIILALSLVALYYLVLLLRSKRAQARQRELQQQQQIAQRARLIKSVRLIAHGMIEDQLSLTEGAIRIGVLLESLMQEEQARTEFRAFYLLADATQHIPILDAWKQLSTRRKLGFDLQREQLEIDHREFVLDAARRLLEVRWDASPRPTPP